MNIAEMHVLFRQYAQQMGMQNVRALLPEQIDLLLNTSIDDTVNDIISKNIIKTNDRVIADSSKLNQINSLRTLYKVETVEFNNDTVEFHEEDTHIGKFIYFIQNLGLNYLYLVDLSVNYAKVDDKESEHGWSYLSTPLVNTKDISKPCPVRIVDETTLSNCLHDYILKPTFKNPLAICANEEIHFYFGEMFPFYNITDKDIINGYTLKFGLSPYQLKISYIDKPAKVKYVDDINGISVNCNLPDFLHIDIVKHAVDLYNVAINKGGFQNQNYSQQQQINPNAQYQQS